MSDAYESPNGFEHWDAMEARVAAFLDDIPPGLIEARGQGRAAIEGLLSEFRHVIRYARDGESGQRVLVSKLAAAEAALDELERENALLRQILSEGHDFAENVFKHVLAALILPDRALSTTPEEPEVSNDV